MPSCDKTYHCPDCKYPFDVVQMQLSISKKLVRHANDDIRQLRYAYPNQQRIDENKLSMFMWILEGLRTGKDWTCCSDECNIQAVLEIINRAFPPTMHGQCRDDLIINEENRLAWNESNPYCVSRNRWEKLLHYQCDLTFTTSHEIIPCELVAYFSAAKVACDLEFQQQVSKIDCSLFYEGLVTSYDCSLTYEQYNELINCNLTPTAISYIYECGMTITPSSTLQDCTLNMTDGSAIRVGDLLETSETDPELLSFLEGGCNIDLTSISTELL